MTIDTKDILNSILASISRIDYIKPDEIPGIYIWIRLQHSWKTTYLLPSVILKIKY